MEIERKFLVNKSDIPYNLLKDYLKKQIVQYYLSFDPEIRIRKIYYPYTHRSIYVITKKNGKGLSRQEIEIDISKEEYLKLKKLSEAKIEKIRYCIIYKDLILELDFYSNIPLITIEIEFDTIKEAKQFKPLKWFGKEITEDEKYKNKNLAQL